MRLNIHPSITNDTRTSNLHNNNHPSTSVITLSDMSNCTGDRATLSLDKLMDELSKDEKVTIMGTRIITEYNGSGRLVTGPDTVFYCNRDDVGGEIRKTVEAFSQKPQPSWIGDLCELWPQQISDWGRTRLAGSRYVAGNYKDVERIKNEFVKTGGYTKDRPSFSLLKTDNGSSLASAIRAAK